MICLLNELLQHICTGEPVRRGPCGRAFKLAWLRFAVDTLLAGAQPAVVP
jgi:hypothetical protein